MKVYKKSFANYSIEDFLLDEDYLDWIVNGKDKNSPWLSRLNSNPILKDRAKEAEHVIRLLSKKEVKKFEYQSDRIKKRIDDYLDSPGKSKGLKGENVQSNRNVVWRWAVAASLAILLSVFLAKDLLFLEKGPVTINNPIQEKNTISGQKLTVHLSDGSRVILNSGSSISYAKYFSDSSRVVRLQGEAFFEVSKNPDRPFRVIAGNTVTEAIGTSFTINSHYNESVNVALLTGKVYVAHFSDKSKVILSPGQMIKSNEGGFNTPLSFGYDIVAWKDNVLIFDNASRREIFESLKKWFGVVFEFKGSFNTKWNYSGRFDNQSLENILRSIGFAEGFNYEIKNKVIVIKSRNTK